MKKPKMLLIGVDLENRTFNGSNQALSWLASALHNTGYEATLLDLDNPRTTLDDLLKEADDADFIGFAGTFSTQLDQIDEYSRILHDYLADRERKVPIIVGGYGASEVARYAAHAPQIDGFFFGPGVEEIVKIARAVEERRFYEAMRNKEIRGLSYFDRNTGKFERGYPVPLPSSETLGSIDQIFRREHIPEKHDMGDIFKDPATGRPLKTFQLVTELGCPWQCSFCSESGGENDVMYRGRLPVSEVPEETIEDILKRASEEGYEAVYFDIETAFRNWKRMEKILEMARRYGLVSGLNTRIDTATRERIKRAAELGVVYQFYGVEHIDPQVLIGIDKFLHRDMGRRVQAAIAYQEKVRDVYTWLREEGIKGSLFMIMGLPKVSDESWEKILSGEITDPSQIEYVPTTTEDDIEAIRKGFELTQPAYFNANILRFNPDTAVAWQPRYACVRPSGDEPLDAAWFVPRVARELGLPLQDYHPIYRFFEGVESNQPYSTAMTPERAYKTIETILECANRHGTEVHFDPYLSERSLITRDKNGNYKLAPFSEFEKL